MKHAKHTDKLIEIIDKSISNFEIVYNNETILPYNFYLNELSNNTDIIISIDKDEIKNEFWILFNEINNFQSLNKLYQVKLKNLYAWYKSIENIVKESDTMLFFEIDSRIKQYLKKKRYGDGDVSFESLDKVNDYFYKISMFLLEIYNDFHNLMEQAAVLLQNNKSATLNNETESIEIISVKKNKDFTTKRQVLAMYYLFNEIGCTTATVDRTVQARFIEFMTGKNYDSIYKTLSNPFKALSNTKNINAIKDMEYIKNQFINLELKRIAERIERDKKI